MNLFQLGIEKIKLSLIPFDQKVINWVNIEIPSKVLDMGSRIFSLQYDGYNVRLSIYQDYIFASVNELYTVYSHRGDISNSSALYIVKKAINEYHKQLLVKELNEINPEDVKFIFQDIIDLDDVSDFKYSNLEITFSMKSDSDYSKKDYKSLGEFYIILDKSLKQLKSSFNVDIMVECDYDYDGDLWTILLTID